MKESNNNIGISERKAFPALTIMLGCLALVVYYYYQSAHSMTWITNNTFCATKFFELYVQGKWAEIAHILFVSNFACLELWQLLISIYFLCLFGIPVEKRLGPLRFILLVLLVSVLPWFVQFWDISQGYLWPLPFEHAKNDINIFGPVAIMAGLAGAYMVLAPGKEKDPTQSRLYRKDRTEIFDRSRQKLVSERFGFSRGLCFLAFCFYAVGERFALLFLSKNCDSIGIYATLCALVIGYCLASFVTISVQDTFQEHPLKHAAIKKYYELVDLDVSHDNAVRGAAKSMGLPDYQVEAWVKKNKGKLRPT